ncbi:MAG: DUF2993 domain-containing protein [Pseudanabaenaceae cyanobacterium bins.68]|nr:DUF2993 domain-containing protein [Pseudanabaenaceae cyanobacterium bins.68]
MELLAGILTGLLGIVGVPGIVLDRLASDLVRQQVSQVEILEVRIDNSPSYQLLLGRVDRLRLAARGIYPFGFLRIDTLELETAPIAIEPSSLQGAIRLRQPLQAAVRLVLTAEDLNRALRSPEVMSMLPKLKVDLANFGSPEELAIKNPQIIFLGKNRLRLMADLQPSNGSTTLPVQVEAGLSILAGKRLELIEPQVSLRGVQVPRQLTQGFSQGLNRLLDLSLLEQSGIDARVLQLAIEQGNLQLIGYARLEQFR